MSNQSSQNAKKGPQKIGNYEIHTIETGSFGLDGGAMFGIVPKTIWNKTNPADDQNRIEMRLRCLLLLQRDKNFKVDRAILVDNGIGTKWADKFKEIYKIDHHIWKIDSELGKLGLKCSEITDLIGTHLHFDHMGGTTFKRGNEIVPTFEKAKLWIQELNWDNAYHPNEKDRASYLKENFDYYNGEGKSKLHKLTTKDGAREEIMPGIFVRISNGHTRGMQLVEVSDANHSILYCADAIPTETHVRVPFIMGYDCYPLTMIEEKKKILAEATSRGTLLFLEHCPHSQAVSVYNDGKDFAVKDRFQF